MKLASTILRSRQATTWILMLPLLASGAFGAAVFADDDDYGEATVRVMTQNVFMGTDFPELLAAQTPEEFVHAVTTTYNNVLATRPAERMAAVAREIARRQPDLIGLQEAAILRTGPTPPASDVEVDMLQILLGELDTLGEHYVMVAILSGLDAGAPSDKGFEVRFTVQDVILARAHRLDDTLRLSNVHVQPYVTQITFPTALGPITNPAGWASVDVRGRGWKFRFVTTHVAIAPNLDPTVALAQARELRKAACNRDLPVVCVGDFNSTASERRNTTFKTYQSFIDAGFWDAWRHTHHSDPGFTCCQSPDVSNAESSLSQRIDPIFVRGNIDIVRASRVGARRADRTPSGLWPSDHAGVTATLRLDR